MTPPIGGFLFVFPKRHKGRVPGKKTHPQHSVKTYQKRSPSPAPEIHSDKVVKLHVCNLDGNPAGFAPWSRLSTATEVLALRGWSGYQVVEEGHCEHLPRRAGSVDIGPGPATNRPPAAAISRGTSPQAARAQVRTFFWREVHWARWALTRLRRWAPLRSVGRALKLCTRRMLAPPAPPAPRSFAALTWALGGPGFLGRGHPQGRLRSASCVAPTSPSPPRVPPSAAPAAHSARSARWARPRGLWVRGVPGVWLRPWLGL